VYTNENESRIINNKQFGLWGGFGVLKTINSKLNAFLELRYEQTNGIRDFGESKISNFQLLIGIRTK
jgi:hypothetical protein